MKVFHRNVHVHFVKSPVWPSQRSCVNHFDYHVTLDLQFNIMLQSFIISCVIVNRFWVIVKKDGQIGRHARRLSIPVEYLIRNLIFTWNPFKSVWNSSPDWTLVSIFIMSSKFCSLRMSTQFFTSIEYLSWPRIRLHCNEFLAILTKLFTPFIG